MRTEFALLLGVESRVRAVLLKGDTTQMIREDCGTLMRVVH